jgi:hypothetical protein
LHTHRATRPGGVTALQGVKRAPEPADIQEKRELCYMHQQVDTIRIMCPALTCRRILAVPASSRGKNVRCKSCVATIRVPDRSLNVGLAAPAPVASADPGAGAPAGDKQEKPAA